MQTGKLLLIIAEDVEGEALTTPATTRSVAPSSPPPSRPRASAIAARKCCRTWPSSPVVRLSPRPSASSWRPPISICSAARAVVLTKDETTIVEGVGDEDQLSGRKAQIKTLIENSTSEYDTEKLQERLAKLAGGVAVIKAGAATEVELKERKHRIEDAVRKR